LELAIGTQSSLPSRYNVGNNWGRRYPNCIDPCVFYDEDGKLRMSYGSWSGGIYMLELNQETGLRDYDVTYTLKGSGDGITVDPYFGKKIAGGYYASGEASYIEYIGGYYYLFVSNGGLAAGGKTNDYNYGGYQMRVFRSKNPDGPYVDSKNSPALYPQYLVNFGVNENDGNRGVNIFGAYGAWGYQAVGNNAERSQGHNSIIAAEDGRTYLVYIFLLSRKSPPIRFPASIRFWFMTTNWIILSRLMPLLRRLYLMPMVRLRVIIQESGL